MPTTPPTRPTPPGERARARPPLPALAQPRSPAWARPSPRCASRVLGAAPSGRGTVPLPPRRARSAAPLLPLPRFRARPAPLRMGSRGHRQRPSWRTRAMAQPRRRCSRQLPPLRARARALALALACRRTTPTTPARRSSPARYRRCGGRGIGVARLRLQHGQRRGPARPSPALLRRPKPKPSLPCPDPRRRPRCEGGSTSLGAAVIARPESAWPPSPKGGSTPLGGGWFSFSEEVVVAAALWCCIVRIL